MYPYIVCFCGREIGHLFDLFTAMKEDLYISEFGDMVIDPSIIPLTDTLQISLTPIFDALHIHLDCCKSRLMTGVQFKEIY